MIEPKTILVEVYRCMKNPLVDGIARVYFYVYTFMHISLGCENVIVVMFYICYGHYYVDVRTFYILWTLYIYRIAGNFGGCKFLYG